MLFLAILATCWLRKKKQLSAESDKSWSWHKGKNSPTGRRERRNWNNQQVSLAWAFTGHNKSWIKRKAYTLWKLLIQQLGTEKKIAFQLADHTKNPKTYFSGLRHTYFFSPSLELKPMFWKTNFRGVSPSTCKLQETVPPWWFSYLSSYSDLRLKLGQFFLVHSAASKEKEDTNTS